MRGVRSTKLWVWAGKGVVMCLYLLSFWVLILDFGYSRVIINDVFL